MEKMPYQVELEVLAVPSISNAVAITSWQHGLPTLGNRQVVLRELRASDAASLHALLTTG